MATMDEYREYSRPQSAVIDVCRRTTPQRISMPKLSLPRSRSGRDRRISPQKSAARRIALLTGSLVVAAGGVLAAAPHASAASCPDVEVVFARGTAETAPPVGLTGLSFAQALRAQLPGKSVAVYGVDYPASNNFNNRVAFVRNVVAGITDAQDHIKATAARCPNTGIVLGGYSQGGAVAARQQRHRRSGQIREARQRVHGTGRGHSAGGVVDERRERAVVVARDHQGGRRGSASEGLVERLGWRHAAQDRRGGEVKNPLLAM